MKTQIPVEDLASVEKLSLRENDVLLLRVKAGTSTRAINQLRDRINMAFWHHNIKAHVFILSANADVRHLTVEEMEKMGWTRK